MDHTPSRRLVLFALLAPGLVALSCAEPRSRNTPGPEATPRTLPPESSDQAGGVVEAHNVERSRRGLPPLGPNPELEAVAMAHARDMSVRGKMSHKGSDGSSPFDRIEAGGYSYRAAGENVAAGFDDVPSVMGGWMRSPGHKRNILGQYAEVGVGRAIAKDGVSYWCVTFGTPRSPESPARLRGVGYP